ncbi:hypothetical protein LTR17_009989 [Elasticomyces elasticus]|nr:hypothetical protein LTR17_009989 [Elasticomyces elasticus]
MLSPAIRRKAFTLGPRNASKHAVFRASDITTHLSRATFTSTVTRPNIRSRLANLLGMARQPTTASSSALVPNVAGMQSSPALESSRAPLLIYCAGENAKPAFTSYVDVERSFYPTLALRNELERAYSPTQNRLPANPDPSAELRDLLRQLTISGTPFRLRRPSYNGSYPSRVVDYGKQWEAKVCLQGVHEDAAYVHMQAGCEAGIVSMLADSGWLVDVPKGGSHELVKIADLRVTRQEWKVMEKQGLGRMPLKVVEDRMHTGHHLFLNDTRIEHVEEFTEGEHIEEYQRLKREAVEGMRRTSAEFLARHPTLFKTESMLQGELYPCSKGVLGAYFSNIAYRKREWDTFPVAWKREMGWTTQEEYEKYLESDEEFNLNGVVS